MDDGSSLDTATQNPHSINESKSTGRRDEQQIIAQYGIDILGGDTRAEHDHLRTVCDA